MGSMDGQVALITGASRGIGRATALRMAREGARIVVNYVSDAGAAETLAEEIAAAGSQALPIRADTTDESQIRAMFAQALAHFGRLDVVVNNAHKGSGKGTFADLDMAVFDQQATVLRGQFVVLQEAARHVADGGCIINISSGTTRMARPEGALYSGFKSALEQWTRVLSKELGFRGVNVNTVSPGLTATDRVSGGDPSTLKVPPTVPPTYPATRFDRPGHPEEIAEVICFLASPAGRWINTQNVTVNGGATWR